MRHRHLNVPEGHYSIAAIHSILERGGASDIKALLRAVRDNPFSEVADMAAQAAGDSEVYGYPTLILECIKEWRRGVGQPAGTR
jgi:hypothetical protein